MNKCDLVADWTISLPDGIHKVEFEHGTTSGKRVIWVDGKVNILFMILLIKNNLYILENG